MPRRKLRESLTARIFGITAAMLLAAGAVTFALIAWATPLTYTAVVTDDLQREVDRLVDQLSQANFEDCGPILDEFFLDAHADALLVGADGRIADVNSDLVIKSVYDESVAISIRSDGEADLDSEAVAFMTFAQDALFAQVQFADRDEPYSLYVTPHVQAENLAVRALGKMAPWLLLLLLLFSLLCALVYSRCITRPILRLSGIAGRMADLDFHWRCGERRRDEIGDLGRSLDQMAQRLSAALQELESANESLRGEMERERERERQRTAFFSAASHELKTPLTILQGQLTGMLEGVGVYRDREKYLGRALQVAGRMEALVREMLVLSRAEAEDAPQEVVDLSALAARQICQDAGLWEQRGQRMAAELAPGVLVRAVPALLQRVVDSLLSNAALYAPEGAQLRVWCGRLEGAPALVVENDGSRIGQDALPHLFEPFFREEGSRNRATGGSGLGLYLVERILRQHGASCAVENTASGVRATVRFPAADGAGASAP